VPAARGLEDVLTRRAAAAAASLLVAVSLAGCGGASHSISAKDLNRLVLTRQQVGRPFASFDTGPQTQLDNQGTPRANPTRDGREGGWIARYHRSGSTGTKGPLVVESRVDVFKSPGGATKDLAAYGQMFDASPGASRRQLTPNVGDSALGVTFLQPGPQPLRFYRIAWRYRNATASVTAEGFAGKLDLGQALALARKQQRLLART